MSKIFCDFMSRKRIQIILGKYTKYYRVILVLKYEKEKKER